MRPLRPRGILRLAALVAAVSAVVWVMPPPVPSFAAAETPPPRPNNRTADGAERAAALLEFDDIVLRDPFSPERRAPAPAPAPPPPRAPTAPATPALRLYGVAQGPQGAVALIDADPDVPGAEIYRLGDLVAGYRLAAIDTTFVVLDGPGGRRTLRLALPQERSP